MPEQVAADSIVNRLANNARIINLGQIDMRRHRNDHARPTTATGTGAQATRAPNPGHYRHLGNLLPSRRNTATTKGYSPIVVTGQDDGRGFGKVRSARRGHPADTRTTHEGAVPEGIAEAGRDCGIDVRLVLGDPGGVCTRGG